MDAPPPPRAPHTPKKRKFDRVDEQETPPGSAIDGAGVDLINTLPDAVLCTIISLLPTKVGARTQAVCARWRPLWRSAPLNLVADCDLSGQEHKRVVYISKILSEHPGPALRLSLPCIRRRYHGRIECWLRSQALTDLQELHFGYEDDETLSRPPLPPSALRFVPTLRVASFSCCHFPDLSSQSLNFPHLHICFPELRQSRLRMEMKNVRKYDPLDPIECLEIHLKRVVLQTYFGNRPDVDFAKFFVLNAKGVEGMKFGAINSCNDKWKSNQHRRLQVENRASPDARFDFIASYGYNFTDMKHAHDLSMADPFERTLL